MDYFMHAQCVPGLSSGGEGPGDEAISTCKFVFNHGRQCGSLTSRILNWLNFMNKKFVELLFHNIYKCIG